MEDVFRALADPTRRQLLDALFEDDGQSLSELCEQIPQMTRFGVMKHLSILEAAHLVTTRREGREKFHYLNPVPIAEIHDRWVSKYAAPFVSALAALKGEFEDEYGADEYRADEYRGVEYFADQSHPDHVPRHPPSTRIA